MEIITTYFYWIMQLVIVVGTVIVLNRLSKEYVCKRKSPWIFSLTGFSMTIGILIFAEILAYLPIEIMNRGHSYGWEFVPLLLLTAPACLLIDIIMIVIHFLRNHSER